MVRPVRQSQERKGEQGAVLVVVAVAMLALILIAGLCVDFGHFYAVRTELQNAADAAALSGASALNDTMAGLVEARERATASMNKYEFQTSLGQLSDSNFYVATNFADLNNLFGPDSKTCEAIAAEGLPATVRRGADTSLAPTEVRYVGVCLPAPTAAQVMFLASVIGSSTMPLRGKAIAGKSPPLTSVCDVLAPVALVQGAQPLEGTNTYTLFDPEASPPGGPPVEITPSNYQLLGICGSGGMGMMSALGGGCSGCHSIGGCVNVTPGSAFVVREGLNDRFMQDLVVADDITYAEYQQYEASYNYSNPGGSSSSAYNSGGTFGRRIITVPVIPQEQFSSNTGGCLTISGFAQFFLQGTVPGGGGGDITAEFLTSINVPRGEFGGANPIPTSSLPVLYR